MQSKNVVPGVPRTAQDRGIGTFGDIDPLVPRNALDFPDSVTDASTAADATSVSVAGIADATEAASGSDASSTTVVAVAAVTESGAATETDAATTAATAATSEVGAAAESLSNTAAWAASSSETASATNVTATTWAAVAGLTEAATATDATADTDATSAAVTESASATDAPSAVWATADSTSESIAATDSETGIAVLLAAASEQTAASDATAGAWGTSSAAVETAPSTDAAGVVAGFAPATIEAAAADDAASGTWATTAALSESANASDTAAEIDSAVGLVVESASADETANAVWSGAAVVEEFATGTDDSDGSVLVAGATAHTAGIEESIVLADAVGGEVESVAATEPHGVASIAAPKTRKPKKFRATISEAAVAQDRWSGFVDAFEAELEVRSVAHAAEITEAAEASEQSAGARMVHAAPVDVRSEIAAITGNDDQPETKAEAITPPPVRQRILILSTRTKRLPVADHRQKLVDLADTRRERLTTTLANMAAPSSRIIADLTPADADEFRRRIDAHYRSPAVRAAESLATELGTELGKWFGDRIGLPILGRARFAEERTPTQQAKIDALVTAIAQTLNLDEEAARAIVERALAKGGIGLLDDAKRRLIDAVLKVFEEAQQTGMTLFEFRRTASELLKSLSRANLETEFRTELSRRFGAAARDRIRSSPAITHLQWLTVGDDRVRATHAAMDHFVAAVDDPIWDLWSVPAGYNCRCVLSPVGYLEAIRNGWAKYAADGHLVIVQRPSGNPLTSVYDPKRKKVVAVRPDPGFEGGAVPGVRAA